MTEIVNQTPAKPGTYLGFDFGNKKIGIAVGNTETLTANGLTTLRAINQKPNWEGIQKVINEWQPVGLVVGLSQQQDGSANRITPVIEKFCRQLNGRFALPVYQIDETLSTHEAKQMLYEDTYVNATRLWAAQDQLAAQLILNSWLNSNSVLSHDHA